MPSSPKPEPGITRDEIRSAVAGQLGRDDIEIADLDDLIQLGLDSIRTMKLAGAWRKRGAAVNFAELAAEPTVDAWHRLLGGDPDPRAAAAENAGVSGGPSSPDPAGPIDPGTPFALAPMQHAYWIGRSEEQELGAVAAHLYVEFDGENVDQERLRAAVDELIRRHPMLRTRFLPDGTQQTLPRLPRDVLDHLDLRSADPAEAARVLESLRERRTHQRLAVADGQVLEIALTLLPEHRCRLHIDVDMLAADAASYRILVDDLARLYHGERTEPPGYTFREYLAGQRPAGTEYERDRRWWQQRLPDLPGAPDLPRVYGAGPGRDPRTAADRQPARTVRFHHWLGPESKGRIFAESHHRRVTPAMALASVFAEAIGGWSADDRFLLNLPLFHRDPVHPEVDGVIGDFTSSVLLEVDISEPATVLERARALQRELHAAGAHTAYSGLEVLRDLGRARGEPVLAPIVYTSAINLGELFSERVTETFGEPVWIISQGPQVLLDAQVTEVSGGLLLNWDVRADAFPPDTVAAMFARYIESVRALTGLENAGTPETGESSGARDGWDTAAAVRLPPEQAEVRRRVNDTSGPVTGRLLHQGLFEYAATEPDAVAVIWESDPESAGPESVPVAEGPERAAAGSRVPPECRALTYRELADRALAIAGALREAGIRPGDAVAIQLPKGPDQIVATVGVLAAGGVYVPIGYDQPAARRSEIVRAGEVRAAVTDGATIPGIPTVTVGDAAFHPRPLERPVLPDTESIAYVLFTSGSTGQPKGVEVPHRAAMNTVDDLNERFGLGPADRVLALSALEFDLSVYDIFGPLGVGGAVVTPDPGQREDPARWVQMTGRHRVSILNCVPSLLDMLLTAAGDTGLGTLRTVLSGGDWVDVALPARLARSAPDCRFAGLGGATETAIHSTICEVVDARVPADWVAVPYGTPLRNVRCRVVGPSGRDCPDWVRGELWVGGAGVAAGYRGDPDRTAQRFVDHEGLRWYRTGDLARYRPDGVIEFLGRADHQVKIRGYRVELGEVESALRSLPEVHHAVAAVVGTAAPALAALVVPADGCAPDAESLRAAVAELLPGYMVPVRIESRPRLPFTANGKPDRKAVAALLASNDPGIEFVAPGTPLESALADIVATVLSVERVSVTGDFFALGGDSVLATTVVARVRELLDCPETVVADFIVDGTIAGLAQRLRDRAARRGAVDRLTAVARVYLEVAGMSDEEVLAEF
ncbi:non-ribosomal peptide synthetase [Nocardia sp. NPDC003963]